MAGPLSDNDVHVWYCSCEDPAVASRLQQYRSLLTDAEVARYERFAFEKDRQLFLVARTLLRTVLSRYAPVPPAAWRFEQTAKGKLFLPAMRDVPPLTFNVSHSGKMAVCAVTLNHNVGVDVESTAREANPKIADYFLSPRELDHYLSAENDEKLELFYRYWTLKESFAKALGMGLSLRFTEFAFLLAQKYPTIIAHPNQPGMSGHWHFHQQWIAPHYWLAVAVQREDDMRPVFTVRLDAPRLEDGTTES